MKTTFSSFPEMFENPAPAVKKSCKGNINLKKINDIRMRRKEIDDYGMWYLNDMYVWI